MEFLSLLPPVLALALAFWTRNVVLSLLLGLALSELLILGGNPLMTFPATIERIVEVFLSPGDAQIILFCLLVGGLLALMRRSGGIAATVKHLIDSGAVATPRKASLATATAGILLFIETNISLLTAGILGRPLFDRLNLSRERLAYIIDSTCSPISVLILFNGWGAYALGLVGPYVGDDAVSVVAGSIPLNFYALGTVALVLFTAWTGKVFGPMARAASRGAEEVATEEPTRAAYTLVPAGILVFGTLGFMMWTGNGDILEGDGAKSVLLAVSLAMTVLLTMLAMARSFRKGELTEVTFSGVGELLPATTVILLALALGDSLRALGTGELIASLATAFPAPFAFPALIFLAAAGTSFAVGTSWGTYGILIPVAMPIALETGIPPSVMLAAVLGGGVFGDHASPISDTTLIASLAAGCDHIEHVRTQLPYALLAAAAATLGYLAIGIATA
ncbi:Na+/H+ antiporter NhaC family protein [Parvularcula lutaonensis]|uniref:Na+/H+ antiporter NhaC family protein n=1 Tax=Parvularcula lutaonensis TaxID=491923 RepID=A0ABV7MBM0_9PROT|nr:Na+/H+ antiporter NhaC family protein [Parvularcula lutaonensis]GGY40928.1 sodium:proton antiporter [Parvularcula lutaonensis]